MENRTELVFASAIQRDPDVLMILTRMVGDFPNLPQLPKHEFFDTERWWLMLDGSSYSFPGHTGNRLDWEWTPRSRGAKESDRTYYLTIRCNLLNSDGKIEKFLDWLSPYIQTNGFLGYTRGEDEDNPTLLYFKDHTIEHVPVV